MIYVFIQTFPILILLTEQLVLYQVNHWDSCHFICAVCVCITDLLYLIAKLTILRVKISLKENDHFSPVKSIPLKVEEMQGIIDLKQSINLFPYKCNPLWTQLNGCHLECQIVIRNEFDLTFYSLIQQTISGEMAHKKAIFLIHISFGCI